MRAVPTRTKVAVVLSALLAVASWWFDVGFLLFLAGVCLVEVVMHVFPTKPDDEK
ncbi:MAG: hypothetical protein JNG84_02440 [Archangium sp.]|nr:hypothetical protein [Archangium sp.]